MQDLFHDIAGRIGAHHASNGSTININHPALPIGAARAAHILLSGHPEYMREPL